uniref:Ig-like domain-containing protein n=1 Tax=Photinus pyralis TaxID=7054 RepID=A0A1Y1L8S8_PHOPY
MCTNFYKMTTPVQKIIFITGLFTCNVFSKESEPYLTIMVNNRPLLTDTITVNNGQNVYVDCIAHPSHHSALWLPKGKHFKQKDTISSNTATLNLTDSNAGIYVCQSLPTKLERSVNVVAKKRIRRDGSFDFTLPEGPISFEDALRLQKEFLEKYKLTDYSMQNHIQEAEDRRREAEIERAEEQMKAKKRESVNRTVGVTVGVLAIGGVLIAILCVLCRNSNRKPPTPIASISVPTRTTVEQLRPLNSHTAQSPYRPIETNIAPYPPTSFAVRPTAPTAVEPETPPPPSYTEAVNNMRPTAPAITT